MTSSTALWVTTRAALLQSAPRAHRLRCLRAQTHRRLGKHVAVLDAERADPALAARDVADERAELDELRLGEMRVQIAPHRVVRARRIPADRVGVAKRNALALGEARRGL